MRALLFAFVLTACASATTGTEPAPAAAPAAATVAERFFPLEEGKIYSYATRENDDAGMLVAKVHRSDATHGELRLSNATKRFAILPDGIAYVGGAYVLKTPLDQGASWPGEHGGTTTIASTDVSLQVPAGSYAGCLQTVEERGRVPGARWETTYCPGIGMVLLVVTAPVGNARAELKSYGAPVKIEGTGLRIDK